MSYAIIRQPRLRPGRPRPLSGGTVEGYYVHDTAGNVYMAANCPPGWPSVEEGGDMHCYEPEGVPTLAEGCPGMYLVIDPIGKRWCDPNCPSGYAVQQSGSAKQCIAPAKGSTSEAATSSRSAGGGTESSSSSSSASSRSASADQAGAGLPENLVPILAFSLASVALLGAAAYYAWS